MAPLITFCIVHYRRLPCLKKCIDSIEKYISLDHEILVLRQGYQGEEAESYLRSLEKKWNVKVIRISRNVGPVRGKGMLVQMPNTPFVMILDNDIYVTEGWLEPALEIFRNEKDVGVVTFPRYYLDGKLESIGGHNLKLENGVVEKVKVEMPHGYQNFVEVNSTGSGAIVMRREVREDFYFDPRYAVGFGDLDKDIQLLNSKWRKVICLESKVFHDPPEGSREPEYLDVRYDWIEINRSYARFRKKWGLRLPLREHLKLSLRVVEFPFDRVYRRMMKRFPFIKNLVERAKM